MEETPTYGDATFRAALLGKRVRLCWTFLFLFCYLVEQQCSVSCFNDFFDMNHTVHHLKNTIHVLKLRMLTWTWTDSFVIQQHPTWSVTCTQLLNRCRDFKCWDTMSKSVDYAVFNIFPLCDFLPPSTVEQFKHFYPLTCLDYSSELVRF